MRYSAYREGRQVAEGHTPTPRTALGRFPGHFEMQGDYGRETKWTNRDGLVVYIHQDD